jgi:hypothetical protein
MRRVLGIVAIVLAVLIDGFFALVNFYPVSPVRPHPPRRQLLMALDPAQARWFRDNLLAEFNEEQRADVELLAVDEEQLLDRLAAARGSPGLILAAIPRALGARAAHDRLVRSFETVAPRAQLAADLSAVVPRAMKTAELDGAQFFLPRLTLLDVAVFRLSRVRDAVRHWSLLRPQIDDALRALNGRGLPPHYQLELEPEQWDAFDRFVIGYYWAHRRYDGQPARGRIAHRTGEALDGEVDLTEGLYRAGASDATLAQIDSPATRDYFTWELLYRRHGLYAQSMFGARPLGDDGILDGLRTGELFLATVDQMQAFTLHGGAHRGTPPNVEDPDDLGFAPLPRISSIEMSADGRPLRPGQAFSFREDWVWTLPVNGDDGDLAYELVKFVWERENHYRECAALGTLPLRADVARERSSRFRLVWMNDIFDAAFAEWERAQPVPDALEAGLGSVYAQLFDRIVVRAIEPAGLAALLGAPPAPRVRPVEAALPEPVALDAGPGSDADEDPPTSIDNELWRGKVELEGTTSAHARGAR